QTAPYRLPQPGGHGDAAEPRPDLGDQRRLEPGGLRARHALGQVLFDPANLLRAQSTVDEVVEPPQHLVAAETAPPGHQLALRTGSSVRPRAVMRPASRDGLGRPGAVGTRHAPN